MGFANPVGTRIVYDVCLFRVALVLEGVDGWLALGSGRVGVVMSLCIMSLDYLCR